MGTNANDYYSSATIYKFTGNSSFRHHFATSRRYSEGHQVALL